MAPNGPRLFEGQEIPPLPNFTDELQTLLKSKTIIFKSEWWLIIIAQTRNFYVGEGINLSHPGDYMKVCSLIHQKFPKIPLNCFKMKLSQSFQNYRRRLRSKSNNALTPQCAQNNESQCDFDNIGVSEIRERRGANNYSEVLEITFDQPLNLFEPSDINVHLSVFQMMSTPNMSPLSHANMSGLDVSSIHAAEHDPFGETVNGSVISNVVTTDENMSNIEEVGASDISSCCLIDLRSENLGCNENFPDLNQYFTKIIKSDHRPAPTNVRFGTSTYEQLVAKLNCSSDVSIYEGDTLTLFEALFDHRTLILWNNTEDTFFQMYWCLQYYELMNLEVKLLYGNVSYICMKTNLNHLLKAVQHLNPLLNLTCSLYNFFLKMNPRSDYIQVFRDQGRFQRYISDPIRKQNLCVLLINDNISEIVVMSNQFTLRPSTLLDALFLNILMFHVLEKPFPSTRETEFKFLENFIIGSDELENFDPCCHDILNALEEISTIDGSSAGFLQTFNSENKIN